MSEPQFPSLFGPRNLAETQNSIAYSSPFGKDSMFYTPKVANVTHSATAIDTADYRCQFAYFKSGADLLERYNLIKERGFDPTSISTTDEDDELKISTNALIIMYEEHTELTDTRNFFGTACRVILGEDTQTFIGKLVGSYTDFFLDELFFGQSDLSKFVRAIVDEENEKNKNLKSKIDPTIVEVAILLEYHKIKKKNTFEGVLEGFNDLLRNKTVEGIAYTIEKIEGYKLTAENYEPAHKNYSPLLPVGAIKQSVNSLNEVADILGNVLGTVAEAVQYVFPAFKSSVEVLNDLHQRLKNFIQKITNLVEQEVDIANAFVCGLCNGLYSLVQSVFALLGFVLEKIPFNSFDDLMIKKPIGEAVEKLSDYQIWAEFVEDYVELAIEAVPVLFEKLVEGIKYIITNIEAVWDFIAGAVGKGVDMALDALDKAVGKLAAKTKYWWAFILGAVAFEVIVEVVLALITGGTSVIANASAKISRVLSKTTAAVAKAGAKTIDIAATALKAIRKFFKEMAEALKNGKFIEWVKEKLDELLGVKKVKPTKEDLLKNWDDVSVSGRSRRYGQRLLKSDVLKIEKRLKQLGCEFDIYPEQGSFDVGEGFFDFNGNPTKMIDYAQAGFFYTNKKMKLILREGATTYEFFHEFAHFKQCKSLGVEKYYKLGGYKTSGELLKETYVFNSIVNNRMYFTKNELEHALHYYNTDILMMNGENPIRFDFDIEKHPRVLREIEINKLLY